MIFFLCLLDCASLLVVAQLSEPLHQKDLPNTRLHLVNVALDHLLFRSELRGVSLLQISLAELNTRLQVRLPLLMKTIGYPSQTRPSRRHGLYYSNRTGRLRAPHATTN